MIFILQLPLLYGNCRKAVPFLAVVWYSITNKIKGGPSGVRGGMEGSVDQFEEFYCDCHGDFMCAHFGIFDFCVVACLLYTSAYRLCHGSDFS